MGVLKRKDIRPRETGVILYNKDKMPTGEIDEEINTGGKGCSVRRYVKLITHHQKKNNVCRTESLYQLRFLKGSRFIAFHFSDASRSHCCVIACHEQTLGQLVNPAQSPGEDTESVYFF